MEKSVKKLFSESCFDLLVIAVCMFASNLIINMKAGKEFTLFQCVPALLLFAAASLAGILLKSVVKLNVPAIVYTCLIAAIVSLPCFPWYDAIISIRSGIQFNAVLTPILAFTGLSIGKDMAGFLKAGPKLLLVSVCVFMGTYLGSAVIAQIGLTLTGQI